MQIEAVGTVRILNKFIFIFISLNFYTISCIYNVYAECCLMCASAFCLFSMDRPLNMNAQRRNSQVYLSVSDDVIGRSEIEYKCIDERTIKKIYSSVLQQVRNTITKS